MEIREILINTNAPNVVLEDIRPKSRFIDLIVRSGIETIYQLKNMSDDEIRQIPLMGRKKIVYLKDFFEQWASNGFESVNHVNVLEPATVEQGLREKVFRNEKNLQQIYYRSSGRTYEDIGEYFKITRQGVKEHEKDAGKRLVRWYEANNLAERIGDYKDFYIYCDRFEDKILTQATQYILRMLDKNNGYLPEEQIPMPNSIF